MGSILGPLTTLSLIVLSTRCRVMDNGQCMSQLRGVRWAVLFLCMYVDCVHVKFSFNEFIMGVLQVLNMARSNYTRIVGHHFKLPRSCVKHCTCGRLFNHSSIFIVPVSTDKWVVLPFSSAKLGCLLRKLLIRVLNSIIEWLCIY